jgi:hypothetical protein
MLSEPAQVTIIVVDEDLHFAVLSAQRLCDEVSVAATKSLPAFWT